MLAVAYSDRAVFRRGVTNASDRRPVLTDAQRYGLALKRLRLRSDMSQSEAGAAAGTSQQTWQRYESGSNDALLKPPLQKRLATALGATHEEFLMQLAQVQAGEPLQLPDMHGFAEARPLRRFEFPLDGPVQSDDEGMKVIDDGAADVIDLSQILPAGTRFLRLAGENMYPYAESGGFLSYNVNQPPRRGRGCVIRMKDGTFHVRRYEGVRDGRLVVTEFKTSEHGGRITHEEHQATFDLRDVEGIYLVGLRGD